MHANRRADGVSVAELSNQFGVHRGTVKVKTRLPWYEPLATDGRLDKGGFMRLAG